MFYRVVDFTQAITPRIHFVPKNDNLLISNTKIDFFDVYVRFTRNGLFGLEKNAFFLPA